MAATPVVEMGAEATVAAMGAARRRLEAITSEDARVGNLGPASFFLVCMLATVILLCFFSSFIDKPGPRRGMRIGAAALIIIPTIFFSMTTYVTDTSQIIDERNVDTTYKPRMLIFGLCVIMIVAGVASLFAGPTAPLTMHRQGHNIYSLASKGAGVV